MSRYTIYDAGDELEHCESFADVLASIERLASRYDVQCVYVLNASECDWGYDGLTEDETDAVSAAFDRGLAARRSA